MKKLLIFVLFLQFAVVAGFTQDPEPRCYPCPNPVTATAR